MWLWIVCRSTWEITGGHCGFPEMRGWHSVCGGECPCSRDSSWSIYEWSCVMFSTHFKQCRKKLRERESKCGTQAKSIWIRLTELFFTFYIDLNIFKRKVRDKSRVGKISLQKMWSPVPAHFLSPRLSACSVFRCLIWYIPPKCKNKCRYCCFLGLQF